MGAADKCASLPMYPLVGFAQLRTFLKSSRLALYPAGYKRLRMYPYSVICSQVSSLWSIAFQKSVAEFSL